MATHPFCSFSMLHILLSLGRLSSSLSPPQNLTVKFLDFHGIIHWWPGPGNPSDTNYSVLVEILENKTVQNLCSNSPGTTCPLDIPLVMDDFLKNYKVGVRAKRESQYSAWTNLTHSVQPYDTNVLSPPSMQLIVQNQTVHVFLTYPRLMPKGINEFKYNILAQVSMGVNIVTIIQKKHADSNHTFENLPPGNFCFTASISQGRKHHLPSKTCVYLKFNTGYPWLKEFCIGIPLLLVPFGLITATCCFLKARYHMPTTLGVCVQSVHQPLTLEPVLCEPVRIQVKSCPLGKADQGHMKLCSRSGVEDLTYPMPAQVGSPYGYGLISDSSGGSLSFDSYSPARGELVDQSDPACVLPWGHTDWESNFFREEVVDRGHKPMSETLQTEAPRGSDRAVDLMHGLILPQYDQQMAEMLERDGYACDLESLCQKSCGSSLASFPLTGYESRPDPKLSLNS